MRRGATTRQDGTGQDRTPRRFAHEALARARTELGLTQEQAAAAVGVDVRTWRRYETGAVNAGGAFAVRNASRRQLLGRIARELGLREDDLLVPVAPRPQPRGHVLQPARRFVGRAAEREALARWLADPRSEARVCCVVARGGEGKTALVEHALGDVDDRVVWSLYEQPDPWALLAALRDGDADAHLDPVDAALAALSRAPSRVVVLDGLEMVQSDGDDARARGELTDPALRRFLRAAAASRGGARVLITSRHPVADLASWEGRGAHTLSLGPLRAEDAAARGARLRGAAALSARRCVGPKGPSFSAAGCDAGSRVTLCCRDARDRRLRTRAPGLLPRWGLRVSSSGRDASMRSATCPVTLVRIHGGKVHAITSPWRAAGREHDETERGCGEAPEVQRFERDEFEQRVSATPGREGLDVVVHDPVEPEVGPRAEHRAGPHRGWRDRRLCAEPTRLCGGEPAVPPSQQRFAHAASEDRGRGARERRAEERVEEAMRGVAVSNEVVMG